MRVALVRGSTTQATRAKKAVSRSRVFANLSQAPVVRVTNVDWYSGHVNIVPELVFL